MPHFFTQQGLRNGVDWLIMLCKGNARHKKRGAAMNGGTFGASIVCRIAGLPYRTLANWCTWGLATFEQDGQGTGHRRRFALVDLVRILAIIRLRDAGVSMQGLKKALAILRDEYHEPDPLGSGRLLVVGDRPFYLRGDRDLVDVLKRQTAMERVLLVDLGDLAQETRAKVAALAA